VRAPPLRPEIKNMIGQRSNIGALECVPHSRLAFSGFVQRKASQYIQPVAWRRSSDGSHRRHPDRLELARVPSGSVCLSAQIRACAAGRCSWPKIKRRPM
jgi:hypothetical protein